MRPLFSLKLFPFYSRTPYYELSNYLNTPSLATTILPRDTFGKTFAAIDSLATKETRVRESFLEIFSIKVRSPALPF